MFTPVETTIGAVLLQQATSNLLFQNGNILGASGLIRRLFSGPTKETLAFFTGMLLSYFPLKALAPGSITSYTPVSMTTPTAIITIGTAVLAGWGTKMSNGCTSGHMLCGLPRLSGRSATATGIFFPIAMVTHHYMHPTLLTEACPADKPCYTPVIPSASTTARLVLLATLSIAAARNLPYMVREANQDAITHASNSDKQRKNDSQGVARVTSIFFSGLLFALGLQLSQMSHPDKVTSFLSFPALQHWDPSLLLIIVFTVIPNLIEIQVKGMNSPPSFAKQFSLPTKTFADVDRTFVLGAAAFGVAWGLTGTCPGPAILRAAVQPAWGALWLGGFWLGSRI